VTATTDTPATPAELEALRKTAGAALKDWFEAGVKAGLDPMMMAGQLAADMQELVG
jgi:hypothetical protein